MIKLIKKIDETVHYWEVWNDRKVLTVHYGTVGEEGESEEVKVPLFKSTEKVMARLADQRLEEGYEPIDEEILPEIIVQHKNAGLTMEKVLDNVILWKNS
jgi:predicted DNA-binding WGR domain protein